MDKNCFQKKSYLKPRCKPSRGISHSLSAPQTPLHSNHWSYPHFRSEIVILHSAAAPFRTTNSWRSRTDRYSLRSWSLTPPSELRSPPTLETAVFASLTRRHKWFRARDRHRLNQWKKPFPHKSLPQTFFSPGVCARFHQALLSFRAPLKNTSRQLTIPVVELNPPSRIAV